MMISQNCPKCQSSRVRRGYRRTRLLKKLMFRYNLLCDSCNWEFMGFAVPGTVTTKPKGHGKKKRTTMTIPVNPQPDVENIQKEKTPEVSELNKVEKKEVLQPKNQEDEVKEKFVVSDKLQTKKVDEKVDIQVSKTREAPPGKKIIKKRKRIKEFKSKKEQDSTEPEVEENTKKRIKRRKKVKIKFY